VLYSAPINLLIVARESGGLLEEKCGKAIGGLEAITRLGKVVCEAGDGIGRVNGVQLEEVGDAIQLGETPHLIAGIWRSIACLGDDGHGRVDQAFVVVEDEASCLVDDEVRTISGVDCGAEVS
jgi:hypothetical protein